MRCDFRKIDQKFYFGSKKTINDKEHLVSYVAEHKPPKDIYNIVIHGSGVNGLQKNSDIDLFFICNPSKTALAYIHSMGADFNKRTGIWSDNMTGTLPNKGAFKIHPYTLQSLLKSHFVVYGDNLGQNVRKMIKNYRGKNAVVSCFDSFSASGGRVRKAYLDLNDTQLLVSKPPFPMHYVNGYGQGLEIKCRTLAKHVLTSCAFANCAHEIASGNPHEFSKRTSIFKFSKYFGVKSEVLEQSRKIYNGDTRDVDLKRFATETAYEWFEIFEKVEKQLKRKVLIYNWTRPFVVVKKIMNLRRAV